MAEKFRDGSMGAADAKSTRTFKIVAAVVYLLVFLANYVFDTILQDHMQAASKVWNLVGVVGYALSFGCVLFGEKVSELFGDRVSAAGTTITSVILLVLGICASAGFVF